LNARLALALTAALCGCAAPAATRSDGWRSLIQGDARGWRNVGKATLDPRWQVRDGVLTLTAAGGGDIVSDAQFGDFELAFEWRLPPGGNSGVFYRAADAEPAWRLAPEYQLLDDSAAADRFVASHRAGAVYDLVAPERKVLREPGEYNAARIVACGARVEHWLNGERVAAYELDSADWRERVAASKFAGVPGFGAARRGHIALQDHGNVVSIRGMRIRPLRGCGAGPDEVGAAEPKADG
jgi:hypothetical protein